MSKGPWNRQGKKIRDLFRNNKLTPKQKEEIMERQDKIDRGLHLQVLMGTTCIDEGVII